MSSCNFRDEYGRDAQQVATSVCNVHVDTTAYFPPCSVFLSRANKCNQNLHSPSVGRYN